MSRARVRGPARAAARGSAVLSRARARGPARAAGRGSAILSRARARGPAAAGGRASRAALGHGAASAFVAIVVETAGGCPKTGQEGEPDNACAHLVGSFHLIFSSGSAWRRTTSSAAVSRYYASDQSQQLARSR